jgi:hypothetical protein
MHDDVRGESWGNTPLRESSASWVMVKGGAGTANRIAKVWKM